MHIPKKSDDSRLSVHDQRRASVKLKSFICPSCETYTSHRWYRMVAAPPIGDDGLPLITGAATAAFLADQADSVAEKRKWTGVYEGNIHLFSDNTIKSYSILVRDLHASVCYVCDRAAIWNGDKLLFPRKLSAPLAPADLPSVCLREYNEAREVAGASPRAAAALLRLCVEMLCREVGAEGDTIYKMIGDLVKKGLDARVQKALDYVRIVGNNAAHPGTIDFDDNSETVSRLFKLVHIIVEKMITEPAMVDELFDDLPEGARDAINKRDSK